MVERRQVQICVERERWNRLEDPQRLSVQERDENQGADELGVCEEQREGQGAMLSPRRHRQQWQNKIQQNSAQSFATFVNRSNVNKFLWNIFVAVSHCTF